MAKITFVCRDCPSVFAQLTEFLQHRWDSHDCGLDHDKLYVFYEGVTHDCRPISELG
jgi:hypothetical protein